MTRFAPPAPSPSHKRSSSSRSCPSVENSPKNPPAAASSPKKRRARSRTPLEMLDPQRSAERFVSGPDFDFEGRFAAEQARKSFQSRRMSMAPQQHEKDPLLEQRRQRRMSLQAGVGHGFHKIDVNKPHSASKIRSAKSNASSPSPDLSVLVTKHYLERSSSVLWRDGLLQQWDNLLDSTSGGIKSITVAYEEHRKSLDPGETINQAQAKEISSSKDIHMVETTSERMDMPQMGDNSGQEPDQPDDTVLPRMNDNPEKERMFSTTVDLERVRIPRQQPDHKNKLLDLEGIPFAAEEDNPDFAIDGVEEEIQAILPRNQELKNEVGNWTRIGMTAAIAACAIAILGCVVRGKVNSCSSP